jgi:predicted glutamine amidotransferase
MCICIYKLCGNDLPTKEILKRCYQANRDGAGFSYSYKGTVYTYKGFFKFEKFYNKLLECYKKYNLKEQGMLLHFRIATHGLVDASNCHPFALTDEEDKLKATFTKSKFSVIHNGVVSITTTNSKQETFSDTALFVRDYLSKIATFNGWFDNPNTMELVEQMIESKMAILNGNGDIISTYGFHKADDGNYYSNYGYLESYHGIYNYGFFDDWYGGYCPYTHEEQYEVPLMELKHGETICFDDGMVEEYQYDYHSQYKTYVTEDCEVYTLFEDEDFGDKIPMNKLSFIGNGTIVDDFFSVCSEGIKPADFRKDAVAVI